MNFVLQPAQAATILEATDFPTYQQNCVDKFVRFHSFGKTPACLNKKPNSRHIFVDLHIFVDFAFFPKNTALPKANSK